MVGVNRFTEGNDDDQIELLQITNEDEARQLKRLDAGPPRPRPGRRRCGARPAGRPTPPTPSVNLMPTLIDAVKTYATLGEIMHTLADVFGQHTETPTI